VTFYLSNRDSKYLRVAHIIEELVAGPRLPIYFKSWLSGFIEAEGCFSIRKNKPNSFSIGHKDDIYILEAIKQFFVASNKVRITDPAFYFLEIYKKETLHKIINHCRAYPLLGEKANSLHKFNHESE
jgi:hypothetical protein